MPIHPILSLHKKPNVWLDPQALIQRPEAAAWVAQCIANWSWVESTMGTLFSNLLGTNLPAGAALYNDMTSALSKDRALRSVALAALTADDYALLEALLKFKDGHQRTRDKYAHWYWGICDEITDGLVLVDPRYMLQYRANLLDLHDKGQRVGAEMDRTKIYVARVKDLKADASDFAELAKLVFSFANLDAEKNPAKRERRRLALSSDARIRSILDRGSHSDRKKNSSSSDMTAS